MSRKQELKEAFKQFQRLPDCPIVGFSDRGPIEMESLSSQETPRSQRVKAGLKVQTESWLERIIRTEDRWD